MAGKKKKDLAEKLTTVDLVVAHIKKQMGEKGSLFCLKDENPIPEIESTSTGLLTLDYALGVWGFPRGRIIEIYGPESSGKTSLSLLAIATAQKAYPDKTAAFIDIECSFDPIWARIIGVDTDNLLVSQPDCAEDAVDLLQLLTQTGAISTVVLDSIAGLSPEAEMLGQSRDQIIGKRAELVSRTLRKIKSIALRNKTTIICLNQITRTIDLFSKEITVGGNALKFYASQRMRIKQLGQITRGEDIIGVEEEVTIKKNKVAPPFRVAKLSLFYENGFSPAASIADAVWDTGIIERSGAWINYKDLKVQGRDNFVKAVMKSEQLQKDLRKEYQELMTQPKVQLLE
jgi:recombination protein RecA